MKILNLLASILIILILASFLLPVINKAYIKGKKMIFLSYGRKNVQIELALMIDEPQNRWDNNDKRLEAVLTTPLTFK